MSAFIRNTLVCAALSISLTAWAQQTTPAPTGNTGMDMPSMPGMAQDSSRPATKTGQPQPASASSATMDMGGMDMSSMPGMTPDPATQAKPVQKAGQATPASASSTGMGSMDMPSMPGMDHGQPHAMPAMPAMRMQGGNAPPDARSGDYSDGTSYGDMAGMGMRDAEPLGMLRIDQLEAFDGLRGHGQSWEMEGWYGTDTDKLWLRSEGEHEGGAFDDSDVEALWSHAVATYWDTQLGVRNDFGSGPSRQWLALGVQGLAPYWFELQATAYAASSGRSAARLRADYEWLLTQRLILQPEFELNFYGKADPQRRLGSGLSDAAFGLRLRYEIRRQFAPYVGVVWTQRYGGTADFARDAHQPAFDRQLVAGLRIWF
jgi:copper resistance protein B